MSRSDTQRVANMLEAAAELAQLVRRGHDESRPSGPPARGDLERSRWHIQRGDIIFPKTTTPARLNENFEIFDFELSDDEIAKVTGLDRGQRNGPNPDEFNMVP